ncbi:HEAT repeat domain-containing protein [Candidatus Marithioploca araucensis]|uniref:HEAT repeat domain-containing protein n=1 Tax=Candidatus Marithioploca araucensis TaxID=70273 RepID=A0ABT7VRD8_9GAMM|nr:HEAT repeat domain-containing protein [Candidatus Marithioploca araucensis]
MENQLIDKKKVIETLCHLITTGDEVDRYYVSRTLGVLGEKQAIPSLIQCLQDEDIDVSMEAAEALGRIGDAEAVPALLESLTHDPDGEVKTAVVEALGQIEEQEVIAPLLEVAKTCPDNMNWDEGNQWNAWWDMQLKAVKALGHKRVTEAVPVLSTILTDEEYQDIESEVLTALALMGGEGESVLIQRLTKGTSRERRRAAAALGTVHSKNARKALAEAMTDKSGEVRVAAIRALGKQDAVPYIDIMLRFLKDSDPEMRCAVIDVITALSANNAEIMLEKLAPLLTDHSPIVRAAILKALSGVEQIPQETLVPIRQCLSDPDNTVISTACTLLARIGDQSILPTLLQILSNKERDAMLRSQVATALGLLGNREALHILTWTVGDEKQSVRLAALNALMQLEKHQTPVDSSGNTEYEQNRTPLDVVIAALKGEIVTSSADNDLSPDHETTPESTSDENDAPNSPLEGESATPSESEKIKTASLEQAEIKPSSDEDKTDEEQSLTDAEPAAIDIPPPISTLEAIERDNAAALDDKIEDEAIQKNQFSPEVEEYVKIAQDSIQSAERFLVSKKWDVATDVRHLSARILGDSDKEEAVNALIEALNDDDFVLRREAAISLGYIAQHSPQIKALANAFGSLVTHLNIGDIEIRLASVRTLGYLGNQSAIPVLFDYLQDEEDNVRTQTIHALIALISVSKENSWEGVNIDSIIAQFVKLLSDVHKNVRKAAADALAKLHHTEALDSIIDAAFADAGATARDMGRALRRLDVEQSGAKLLKKLKEAQNSGYRRFVIEMLEEVFMPT